MVTPEKEALRDRLIAVEKDGLGPCVDGRRPKNKKLRLRGPKIQGGVLGVAALGLGKTAEDTIGEADIRWACRKIQTAGFTPAVHGDCGFGRLWMEGKLENLPQLGVSLTRVKNIVEEEGGIYVELAGGHNEAVTVINEIPGMTLEPDGSMFILDAWIAPKFGIDRETLLLNAGEVVRKLHGPAEVNVIK